MGMPKWRSRSLLVMLVTSVRSSSLAARTRRTLAAEWSDELDSPAVRARPEVMHGQEAVGFQGFPVDYDSVVSTVAFGSCSKPEDPQVCATHATAQPWARGGECSGRERCSDFEFAAHKDLQDDSTLAWFRHPSPTAACDCAAAQWEWSRTETCSCSPSPPETRHIWASSREDDTPPHTPPCADLC